MKTLVDLSFQTSGRGTLDITREVRDCVAQAPMAQGLCNLFLRHTSAGLLIQENADPDVHGDLERWLSHVVVDGDPMFRHRAEGPDDMSAHIRTMLTQTSLTIPIVAGSLALGVWQGIYLFEHRAQGHQRHVVVSILG